MMTYQELADAIAKMTDEQKQATVTIEDGSQNECYGKVELVFSTDQHDSLDEDHPILRY